MADTVVQSATQRYALVTGGNKGIGFQICRQLASKGVTVILGSRDEKRGIEAQERLKELGVSDNVVFHQLDVTDAASVAATAEFVESRFGRLDILVNNAGILGVEVDGEVSVVEEYILEDFKSIAAGGKKEPFTPKANGRLIETLERAKECIETNYYGAKRVAEALIPLLQKSDSPRIVNVSSSFGCLVVVFSLQFCPNNPNILQTNEWAKGVFSNKESLTEGKVDEVVAEFLKDFKEGKLQENNWPPHIAAYKVSKDAMNAYTWISAQKYPSFYINSVCPGFSRTDITLNFGLLSDVEAAESPVKMALFPEGGPSGSSFHRWEVMSL